MSDIAGLSVSMHAAQLQQSVSISIAKKSMDSAELAAQELLQMLPAQPGVESISIPVHNANGEVRRRTSPDIFIKKEPYGSFFNSPLLAETLFHCQAAP